MERNNLPPKRFNRTSFQRILLKWHAWTGMIAALFILVLTVTGFVLNHPEATGIHGNNVTVNWILDHYYGEIPDGKDVKSFRPRFCAVRSCDT